ncbi:MAG: glycoside hydrolase family 9 protein [Ignavibacteria bacterium]|nr:glycoside hydrolase family 9 protein [Ignavibacteria bacterium]
MKKQTIIIFFIVFVNCIFLCGCSQSAATKGEIYFRVNQVGYKTKSVKTAIVFSENAIPDASAQVISAANGKKIIEIQLGNSVGKWGNYNYHYRLDFSTVITPGKYYLEMGAKRSPVFRISDNVYDSVADSLITFFQVQRCGPTNPRLHDICHIYDSPGIVGDSSGKGVDVTGGWHDAGDYVKFFNTTAISTYMLLLSYDLNKSVSEFDNNHNGVPDLLEEARVGLDWMKRCNISTDILINQVQDNRDHTVGWRLPEKDTLRYDRPAYKGKGKNLVGLYTASFALASKIWRERFHDEETARRFLKEAENMYAGRGKCSDVDATNTGMYSDKNYQGKLALGAIELFNITQNPSYLNDAVTLGRKAAPDYWWSWGDLNALAHFRIAQVRPEFADLLLVNVSQFNTSSRQNIFNEATSYTWGTTNTFLGCALQAALYTRLNSTRQYDTLIQAQIDFLFGKNPWGVSFVQNWGTEYVKNLHSQVAFFHNGYLPGGISAGPAPVTVLKNFSIKRENFLYKKFNSAEIEFYDDRHDYITNEPTIITNATAILLFLELKSHQK